MNHKVYCFKLYCITNYCFIQAVTPLCLSLSVSMSLSPLYISFYPPFSNSSLSSPPPQGETPLHTACRCGLAGLTAELLQQGANPNLQTQKALPDDAQGVSLQSPLHMAIVHNHPDVVSVILEQKGGLVSGQHLHVNKTRGWMDG